jgi:hypothetical protein
MNLLFFKYWFRRLLPWAYNLKRSTIRLAKNTIPYFQPEVFEKIKYLESNSKELENHKNLKILFYSIRQDQLHVVWNYIISQALRIRGCQIKIIACDGLIKKACNEGWYPSLPDNVCRQCYKFVHKIFSMSNMDVDFLAEYTTNPTAGKWMGKRVLLEWKKAEEIINRIELKNYKDFVYKTIKIGEIVEVSVTHFLRVENIEKEAKINDRSRNIYKRFMIGAVMMVGICKRIIKLNNPDVIFMLNGKFMAERVMLEIAKNENIRTVCFETGLKPDTMIFVHNEFIDHGKIGDWGKYMNISLDHKQEKEIKDYLSKREVGRGQPQKFGEKKVSDKKAICEKLQLNNSKRTAVLFTNVLWDSSLQGLGIAFDSSKKWIESTISFFEQNEDVQLIIRIHPAEIYWPGTYRDSIVSWIKQKYGNKLPSNIKLINPESNICSYSLMEIADVGIVAISTTGLEMAAFKNKPVIVTGNIHYRGKGFTIDPSSEDEYYNAMRKILIDAETKKINKVIALRYCYFIFMRCSLGINSINSNDYRTIPPNLELSGLEDLSQGNDPNLDRICEAICHGTPFN